MFSNSGIDWEIASDTLFCTEFDNETWGRYIPETGQVFCSQCGSTKHIMR